MPPSGLSRCGFRGSGAGCFAFDVLAVAVMTEVMDMDRLLEQANKQT